MTAPEKPLHVLVAEALGCKPTQATPGPRSWRCTCPKDAKALNFLPHGLYDTEYLKNYDTEWSAGGPLLARYEIELSPPPRHHAKRGDEWRARVWTFESIDEAVIAEFGPTPLVAVSRLILALHAEGKLRQVDPSKETKP